MASAGVVSGDGRHGGMGDGRVPSLLNSGLPGRPGQRVGWAW